MSKNGFDNVIEAHELSRDYQRGTETVSAVRGVSLHVAAGERVAIMGPSGCGKSTLLGLLGGMDRPTSGSVVLAGQNIAGYSRTRLAVLRRSSIGCVLQNPSLLPMLSVVENVEIPMALQGIDGIGRRQRALELLDLVELSDKVDSLPEELSGGQQQRVAVARALAVRPAVFLADEPAGSLDSVSAQAVLTAISAAVQREGIALVLVTHERDDARYADRVLHMKDGLFTDDGTN